MSRPQVGTGANEGRSPAAPGLQGPLAPGLGRVISGSGPIGHVLVEPLEDGSGQVQRWVLHEDPGSHFSVEPEAGLGPVDRATWARAVKEGTKRIPRLWRPGAIYVWAFADVYEHGRVYDGVDWTRIPWPLPALLRPPGDARPPGPLVQPRARRRAGPAFDHPGPRDQDQTDPGRILTLYQRADRTAVKGLIYTVGGVLRPTSIEYWLIPAGARGEGGVGIDTVTLEPVAAAPASPEAAPLILSARAGERLAAAGIFASAGRAAELEATRGGFVDELNRSAWGPGCALAITVCLDYLDEGRDQPPEDP